MSETTKHTLFSFVTMRSPELIADEDRQSVFVHHPAPGGRGFFSSLIGKPAGSTAAQLTALNEKAKGFSPFNLPKGLEELCGTNFINFSSWLARNRVAVYNQENGGVSERAEGSPTADPLNEDQLLLIWDNLFYFLITDGLLPAKEKMIEALVANHYLKARGESYQHTYALSRVVVPPALFGVVSSSGVGFGAVADAEAHRRRLEVETPETPEEPETPVLVNTRELQKGINMVLAKNNIDEQSKLIAELQSLQQRYRKENVTAYNAAKKEYDAKAAEAWRSIVVTGEDTGPAEREPAAGVIYTPPSLPRFEFEPAKEIDAERLYDMLSDEARATAEAFSLAEESTFEDAVRRVNNQLKVETNSLFEGTKFSKPVAVVNGRILPVEDGPATPAQQYGYTMQLVSRSNGLYKIIVSINMGYPNADVNNVLYHAHFSNGSTNTDGQFTEHTYGNILVLEFYYITGLEVYNTPFNLEGFIVLESGAKLSFNAMLDLQKGATGIMTVKGGTGIEPPVIPAPQRFGIKRVGIADYRKVEQSVCCYVPGEVSHIENIMAREYKERSTRRLRRSEDTTTTEQTTETESLTDTTSTDRFEMQQQTAKAISESTSIGVNASVSYSGPMIQATLGGNYAHNTSTQESNNLALSFSKDITQKASEKIVQKVRKERILKIIDEFEEQNKHGYDNREGDVHISGVYRWIDKIYKNQVYNYGKRLMYEFMIPQPAVFHQVAMVNSPVESSVTLLQKPVDPRTFAGTLNLKDYKSINENTMAYWAALYNCDVEVYPQQTLGINKSFNLTQKDTGGNQNGALSDKIALPDGYRAVNAVANFCFFFQPSKKEWTHAVATVGDKSTPYLTNDIAGGRYYLYFDRPIDKEVGVSIESGDLAAISLNVLLNCERTDEHYKEWQIKTFNLILEAYEKKLAEYNKLLADTQITQTSRDTNPGFYRQIENTVLRKNCITYLVTHDKMGQKFYTEGGTTVTQPTNTQALEDYSALVKFIEQAFEWEIMSYTFYPFYWASKADWQKAYQQESDDPIFRAFLQSGMARAIVTVRPGFEEAVMYYMTTGKIWNGGQVPTIGDDLYLSIVEELKHPTYYVEETWETRVPTTLTVIQSGGIGLEADGLPCSCGDPTGISQSGATIQGGGK